MCGLCVQEHKEMIAEVMEPVEFSAGQQLYSQGDTGSRCYVIKQGAVACSKVAAGNMPASFSSLGVGAFFGERSLIQDEVRSVSLVLA